MFRELALHILDLVENSLQAGATLVTIEIIEDEAADRLTISVDSPSRIRDSIFETSH